MIAIQLLLFYLQGLTYAKSQKTLSSDFSEATRSFVGSMFPSKADPALINQIVNDMSSGPKEVGISAISLAL